jgi:uncharacterized membrane protein YkoI
MSFLLRIAMVLLVAMTLSVGAAADHDAARDAVRDGRAQPLGAIVSQVQRRQPGRLLDADLNERGGRLVYRLRWMTPNGNVLNMIVDARSGRVLSVKGKR